VPDDAESTYKPADITRLLLKAVKALPDDEQRAVFEYFFEKGAAVAQPSFLGQLPPGAELAGAAALQAFGGHDRSALAALLVGQKPMGGDQVTVPVRLSEAQHRRLKQWCAEHNFPMAVVVRGLIDRFLDSWDKRTA
jgi:hypothetical protein